MPVPVPIVSPPPSIPPHIIDSISSMKKQRQQQLGRPQSESKVLNGNVDGSLTKHRRKQSQQTNGHANGTLNVSNGHALHDDKKEKGKRVVDWEIPRKTLHSSIGFGVLYLYSQQPQSVNPVIYALAGSLCVIVPSDVLRLNYPPFEKIYEKWLGFLMRESEKKSTNGVIWYMIGVIYTLALLPRDIAVASILILSWCDTAASTFGRMYGPYTPPLPRKVPLLGLPLAPRKSLAGSLAASVTGMAIAIGLWGYLTPQWQGYDPATISSWGQVAWKWSSSEGVAGVSGGWISLIVMGVVTGLIAGLTEALDLGNVDDNLSLPVISGTIILGLSKLASWFFGSA